MSNPEANLIVYHYLKSVAPKLAKKVQKQLKITEINSDLGLLWLIQFYKSKNPASEKSKEVENDKPVKKGKKRKLSERDEKTTSVPEEKAIDSKTKKKKKKKLQKTDETVQVTNGNVDATENKVNGIESDIEVHEIQADEAQNEQVSFGGMVGDSVTEATENTKTNKKKSKQVKRQQNASFKRVKEEEVVIANSALADNSFDAKKGADGYGFKANQILKFTKGKSFRHEKTKKKRGTYKGGTINMGVTSIKFDSDSD